MWINKNVGGSPSFSRRFRFRSLECDAMKWNEMEWRVFCTLDNKKLFHALLNYLCGPEKRRTRLTSSSPFSRRISGMLCSMCRPERNWLPLEKCARKCRKSKSKRPRKTLPRLSLSHRSFQLSPPFFYRWRNIGDWYKLISMKLFIILFLGSIYKYLVELLIFFFFYFRRKTIALFLNQDAFFIFKCFWNRKNDEICV